MTYALALVMLCMGLSLKFSDFSELFKQPKLVVLAAVSQYTVMPLTGWLVATAFGLPKQFAVGLIVLACCPGGAASNLIAYIGRANLALSVVSTAVSTVLGIVMTPLLTKILAGGIIPIDCWGMLKSVFEIVFIPVMIGVLINWKFPSFVEKLGQTGPVLSTVALAMVSGAVIAPAVVLDGGREYILNNAWILLLAASILHGVGFLLGYYLGKIFGYCHDDCKSISCETGMQNGGLASTLAKVNFPGLMPMVGVPSIFCSIVQSVIGGVLGVIWRIKSDHRNTIQ